MTTTKARTAFLMRIRQAFACGYLDANAALRALMTHTPDCRYVTTGHRLPCICQPEIRVDHGGGRSTIIAPDGIYSAGPTLTVAE